MKVVACSFVALVLSSPVFAQSPEDQTAALAKLQAHVDTLDARLTPAPAVYGSTDVAVRIGPWLFVSGWAIACGQADDPTIEVELDGVIRHALILSPRVERADVHEWATSSGACPSAPLASGVRTLLYLQPYNPTAIHSARLRVRRADGGSTPFNVRVFNLCGIRPDGSHFCQ